LAEYLNKKRAAFPRFFFLPNDDLLQILSHAKDPEQVKPHLKKIFEGINSIELKDNKVTSISSNSNEIIVLDAPISTVHFPVGEDGVKATEPEERSVEEWIMELESELQLTLRQQFMKCSSATREDHWFFSWPGQVVLTLSQCEWTSHVEESVVAKKKGSLKACLNSIV